MHKDNPQKNLSNNTNLLITMYTCLLAPLIAHLLDLLLKDKNIWTTERILIVYLALLTGQIIFS